MTRGSLSASIDTHPAKEFRPLWDYLEDSNSELSHPNTTVITLKHFTLLLHVFFNALRYF